MIINTYYYYRVSNGSIALESYTDENKEEHVSPYPFLN